jgi:VanZ family protein
MASSATVFIRWAAALVYAVLIFILSSHPIPPGFVPRLPYFDKLVHFLAYGLLAVLLFRALWPDESRPIPLWLLVLGVVLATVYGAAEEFHQNLVPTRECDWLDMAANGAGAAVAAAAWEPLTATFRWLK